MTDPRTSRGRLRGSGGAGHPISRSPRTSRWRAASSAASVTRAFLAWVVNAYTLVFGGLLLLGGRSGDLLGRRRIFVTDMLIFAGASLLGGFAIGFLVTAAIGLLALIIALAAARVTREDLSGVDPLAERAD